MKRCWAGPGQSLPVLVGRLFPCCQILGCQPSLPSSPQPSGALFHILPRFVFRLFLIRASYFFSFTWIGVMDQCNVKRRLEQLLSWLRLKAKQHHAWELLCITKEVTKTLGQLEYLYKHSNEGIQAVINYAYCVGKYLLTSLWNCTFAISKCGTRA